MGITAAQITGFLISHAHPRVAGRTPVVPENVTDQLLLWENEKNRIMAQPAVYLDFGMIASGERAEKLFDAFYNRALKLGACVWYDREKRALAVSPEHYDDLVKLTNTQIK